MNEVKRLRLRYGLTQKQFADKLCVSLSSVKKWETNRRKPRMDIDLMAVVVAGDFLAHLKYGDYSSFGVAKEDGPHLLFIRRSDGKIKRIN